MTDRSSTTGPVSFRIEVICVKCGNIQMEGPTQKGDKFAWMCHECWTPNENDHVHLLNKVAQFKEGNVIYM